MTLEFDHAVIFVRDLCAAREQFESLGFHVESGGDHGPTKNALIPFHDGAYIELIAVKSKFTLGLINICNKLGISQWQLRHKSNVMGRIMQWFSKPYGPVDWCIRATTGSQSSINYLTFDGTLEREFHRETPEQRMLRWTLSAPKNFALPMLIKDITPRNDRAPNFHEAIHKNGAYAIEGIVLPSETVTKIAAHLNKSEENLYLGSTALKHAEPEQDSLFSLKVSYTGNTEKIISAKQALGVPLWLTPKSS